MSFPLLFQLFDEDQEVNVFPSFSIPLEGTVIDGSASAVQSCDNTYWQVQETASGIEIQFTFNVIGQSKKVKVKGRWEGSSGETLSVQAWNGSSWNTIQIINETTQDNTYTINLDSQYTIDGTTRIRVYRATGTTNQLYLDCIHVIASNGDSQPGPSILSNDSIEDIGAGSASFGNGLGKFSWNVGGQFLDQKVVFFLEVDPITYGNGQLIVDITCDSGSLGGGTWVLHTSNDKNPDLTAATSSPGTSISAGQTQRGIGSTGVTFQNGYFSIYLRGNGPFSGTAHISAVYWSTGDPYPGGTLNDLWIPV